MRILSDERKLMLSKWSALIRESRESGMPIKDWLRENNISKDQYYYWRRKIKELYTEQMQPSFVELPVPTVSAPAVGATPEKSPQPVLSETCICATVRIGSTAVDIYNNASPEAIRMILKVATHAE